MIRRPHPRAPHRPIPALDGWRISQHALDRALERGATLEQILAALRTPTLVTHSASDVQRRRCGAVALVVNPAARRIVTVTKDTESRPL